jgi:transcription elongation regulator 1
VKRSFEELLEEIGVHAFSRYEKELQNMKDDPRFLAVEEKKRRQIFDSYCSKAGTIKMNKVTGQERGEGKDTRGRKRSFVADVEAEDGDASPDDEPSTKAAMNAFKALLQEKVLHSDIRWGDIKQALSKDERFDSVKYWEQKELFRDHQRRLEKAEHLRRVSEHRMAQDVRAGIERQMQSNRFDAINNFKALLTEMIRNPLAVWSQEKANLESDPQSRFDKKLIEDSIAQELFLEHVAHLKASSQEKVISVYRKHKVPAALTFSEVSQTFSEDFDFIEHPEEIQKEAWTMYVNSLEDGKT